MRGTTGSAAAPAARCKKFRRGSFIGILLPDRLYFTRVNGRGRAIQAWIDRTNDGLSGMPADGISLPPKKGLRHVRCGGSKVKLHQRRHRAEGSMTACGTKRAFYACRRMSVHGGKAVVRPVFGSIHRTCLSPSVTDRAMEAWYHPSIA